jgi:hypothetical protein
MLHLRLLEEQEQANPKTSRRKELIKIRAEINEIENKKTIQRLNETQKEIEAAIKSLPKKRKVQDLMDSLLKSIRHLRKN